MAAPARQIFMVVAPSGAGKSSLVSALLARDPEIALSVSCTTRAARPGELDGREYHFIDRPEFARRQAVGDFLESAEVHGNLYGTSRSVLAGHLAAGHDVLLEIDWQGAQQVRAAFASAIGIFILPPSIETLEERLRKRGQDSPEVIARRLLAAGGEIAHAPEFDFVIVNEDFGHALEELVAVVRACRLRYAAQAARHRALFGQLGLGTPAAP
jgi:guanylate kinase